MKYYLLLFALMFAVGLGGISPLTVLAAENPAVSANIEIIHLNLATAEQLQALPGVGPALSERIVNYRKEHGPFENVDQLSEVKGIGQAKLAKFKNHLTVN